MTEARSNEAATNAPDTTQRTESAERLARPLIKLAKASGLRPRSSTSSAPTPKSAMTALVAVLKALDVDASSDEP